MVLDIHMSVRLFSLEGSDLPEGYFQDFWFFSRARQISCIVLEEKSTVDEKEVYYRRLPGGGNRLWYLPIGGKDLYGDFADGDLIHDEVYQPYFEGYDPSL